MANRIKSHSVPGSNFNDYQPSTIAEIHPCVIARLIKGFKTQFLAAKLGGYRTSCYNTTSDFARFQCAKGEGGVVPDNKLRPVISSQRYLARESLNSVIKNYILMPLINLVIRVMDGFTLRCGAGNDGRCLLVSVVEGRSPLVWIVAKNCNLSRRTTAR